MAIEFGAFHSRVAAATNTSNNPMSPNMSSGETSTVSDLERVRPTVIWWWFKSCWSTRESQVRPAERQRAPTKKECKLTTPQTFSKPMRKARVPGCNFCETASKAKKWKHCQKMPNSACGKATSCIWHLATGAQTSLTAMAASGCLLQNWLETLCRMHPTEKISES